MNKVRAFEASYFWEKIFSKKFGRGGGNFQDTVEKNLGNVTMNQHAQFEQNRSMRSYIEKFVSKKQGFLGFFVWGGSKMCKNDGKST